MRKSVDDFNGHSISRFLIKALNTNALLRLSILIVVSHVTDKN